MKDEVIKKYLITGGCGFIGTSLIRRILKEQPEAHIRVLDNLSVGSREDLTEVCSFSEIEIDNIPENSGVYLIPGDIRDSELCQKAGKNINSIIHLAANTGVAPSVKDPRVDLESNVFGTFNMLESARLNEVEYFVFASSGAPLGFVEPPLHEELAPHPVSPYGASKLSGEGYCSSYYHTFNINTVALRFGNVYGPGSKNKSSVVAKFIKQALQGDICELYGDGNQTRDFIYINDLLEAVIKASDFEKGGEIFQIATGNELTLNELAQELKTIFEEETSIEMKLKNVGTRLGDVKRNYSDVTKAREILGWDAKVSLHDGLRETVRYLANLKKD